MSQSQSRPRHSLLSLFDPLSDDDTDKENTNAGEASFFQRHIKSPEAIRPAFKSRLIDIGDMTMHEPEANMLTDEEELENELNINTRYDDDNDTLTFLEMAKAATPKWSAKRASTITTPRSSPSVRQPLSEIHLTEETTPIMCKRPFNRRLGTPASKLSQFELPVRQQGSPYSTALPSTPTTFCPPPSIVISPEEPTSGAPLPGNMLGSSVCTLDLPTTSDALLTDTPAPVLISPPSPHASVNDSLPLPSPSENRLRPNLLSSSSHHNNRVSVDLQASFNLQLGSSESSFNLLNDKISFLSTNDGLESFLNNLEDDPSFGDNDFKSLDFSSSKLKQMMNCSKTKQSQPILVPSDCTDCATTDTKQTGKDHNRSSSSSSLELKPDHHPTIDVNEAHIPERFNDIKEQCVRKPAISETTNTRLGSTVLSTPSPSRALQPPPRPVPALKIVKRSKPPALSSQRRASLSVSGAVGRELAPIPASRGIPRLSPPQSPSVIENSTKGVQRSKPAISSSTFTTARPRRVVMKEENKSDTVKVNGPSSSSTGGPRRIIVAATTDVPEKAPALRAIPQSTSSGLRQPAKYATVGSASSIPKPVVRPTSSKLPAPSASARRFGVPSGLGLATRGTRT